MSILYNRIRFTEMVDESLAKNDFVAAKASVASKREHLIKEMRLQHEEAYSRQLRSLTALFQEFSNLLDDLSSNSDAKAVWSKEMKFYPANDGSVTCKVEGNEIMCSDNYVTSEMLVTTKLTREVRTNLINCMVNKKIFVGEGPSGTGKTETCKDTLRMLGMEAMVVSCSDKIASGESLKTLLKAYKETAEKSGGKKCAIILDEFNRPTSDEQIAILKTLLNEGVFVCVTYNPGYVGRFNPTWTDTLPCHVQTYTFPCFGDIASCMLLTEGILEGNEIGPNFVKFIDACKDKMSKQQHYDFGMRGIRTLVNAVGKVMRDKNDWSNAKQSCANTIARVLMAGLVETDRPVLIALLKEFMCEVPAPTKFSVLEDLEFALSVRHGVAVLGNNTAEQVQSYCKELDQKCNAKSASVILGTLDQDFGPNGTVTKALREAVATDGRFHIYISGAFKVVQAEWMEYMNTVLDGNKCLLLENGEKLKLHDNVRIVFFFEHCKEMSPATVSRLTWIA